MLREVQRTGARPAACADRVRLVQGDLGKAAAERRHPWMSAFLSQALHHAAQPAQAVAEAARMLPGRAP
jgi:hypothetical protein